MNANGRGQLVLGTALVLGLVAWAGCSPSDPVGMGATGSGGASADAGGGAGGSGGAGPSSGSGGTGGTTTGSGGAGPTGSGGANPTGSGGAGPTGSGGAGPTGSGGAVGTDAAAPMTDGGTRPDAGGNTDGPGSNFSFFVISMRALQTLSGNPAGFGGDLRFGQADGLSGADELCRRAAEMGMPGAGQKTWRALLSVVSGPGGMPVHARDRIGTGPWHDRTGRLFAQNITDLFSAPRPPGVLALTNDITNERGEPNHYVGAGGFNASMAVDNHDTMTGSDTNGRQTGTNCNDWTSTTANSRPMSGHSWPRSATSGRHWLADHTVPGCTPGVDRTLGGTGSGTCVGCSGGYGGFYCFAL